MNLPLPAPTRFVPFRAGAVQPAANAGELLGRLHALLPAFAEASAARERDRVLPYDWVRRLGEAGLFTLRVPRAHGGPGGTVRQLMQAIVAIASVDSNLAQALRPGFGFVESLLWADDATVNERWLPRVLAGEVFGNAGWERGGPNGQITARITRDGEGWRISGTKY